MKNQIKILEHLNEAVTLCKECVKLGDPIALALLLSINTTVRCLMSGNQEAIEMHNKLLSEMRVSLSNIDSSIVLIENTATIH